MERVIMIQGGPWELATTLHYPRQGNDGSRLPVVIICHGFVGNRVGANRLFVHTARNLAEQGYIVLRFDYAGCGESIGEYGKTGLDALVEQTRYMLDYALDMEGIDRERIILLGHSLGGAVAILTAAKDKRVKTLILWAPVAHPFNDIVNITGRNVYDQAADDGGADYLGYGFWPSFFDSLKEHQPFREIVKFSGDVLLVHGTSDEVIPVDYTFLYQKICWTRSEGQCDKEVILQADHTFSSRHSVASLLGKTTEWLQVLEDRKKEWNGWSI